MTGHFRLFSASVEGVLRYHSDDSGYSAWRCEIESESFADEFLKLNLMSIRVCVASVGGLQSG